MKLCHSFIQGKLRDGWCYDIHILSLRNTVGISSITWLKMYGILNLLASDLEQAIGEPSDSTVRVSNSQRL